MIIEYKYIQQRKIRYCPAVLKLDQNRSCKFTPMYSKIGLYFKANIGLYKIALFSQLSNHCKPCFRHNVDTKKYTNSKGKSSGCKMHKNPCNKMCMPGIVWLFTLQ